MLYLSVPTLLLALTTYGVQGYTSATLGRPCYSSINCYGSEICEYGTCRLPYYYGGSTWLATKYIVMLAIGGFLMIGIMIYAWMRYRRRQRSVVTVVSSASGAHGPGSNVDTYPKPNVPGEQLPPYTPAAHPYPSTTGPQPYYAHPHQGSQPWPQQQGYYYPPPTYPQNQAGPGTPAGYPQYPSTQPPQQYPYPPQANTQSTQV